MRKIHKKIKRATKKYIPRKVAVNSNILLLLLLMFSLLVRVVNLHYNSLFNDEAVYILVGKIGLFEGDWFTLAPMGWMGGLPYIYPSISALADKFGGVELVRLINVIFFVFTVKTIYKISYELIPGHSKHKSKYALFSAGLFALSPIGFYVSRLATYDMPSFWLFSLAVYNLILAEKLKRFSGKYYISAAIFFVLAFFTKYVIAVFFPLLIITMFLHSRKKSRSGKYTWIGYFLVPVVFCLGVFAMFQLGNINMFIEGQILVRKKNSLTDVLSVFLSETSLGWLFTTIGTLGLILKRKYKLWLLLMLMSLLVVVVHLISLRVPTLDKHTLITVGGLSVLSGVGISMMPKKFENGWYKTILLGGFVLYTFSSVIRYPEYNEKWVNTDHVMELVKSHVQHGDVVLTELGAASQLALSDKTVVTNLFTFNWVPYNGMTGFPAIEAGVGDGYFDLIALESQDDSKLEVNRQIHDVIESHADFYEIYLSIYSDQNFEIYKRKY